jgi:penicillin-binding protein 2
MKSNTYTIRLAALVAVSVMALIMFVLLFVNVQIVNGEAYAQLANRRTIRTMSVSAARGEIFDRYGRPLAVNGIGFNIVLDSAYLPRKDQERNRIISDIIDILIDGGESFPLSLPIVYNMGNYIFPPDRDDDINRLRDSLRLGADATPYDVVAALKNRYRIDGFDKERDLLICAVRNEMVNRDFSLSNQYTFAENVSLDTVMDSMCRVIWPRT